MADKQGVQSTTPIRAALDAAERAMADLDMRQNCLSRELAAAAIAAFLRALPDECEVTAVTNNQPQPGERVTSRWATRDYLHDLAAAVETEATDG